MDNYPEDVDGSRCKCGGGPLLRLRVGHRADLPGHRERQPVRQVPRDAVDDCVRDAEPGLRVLLQSIPLLGMLLSVFIVIPASALIWLLLMFKAYQGERFKLPVVGEMAEQRI